MSENKKIAGTSILDFSLSPERLEYSTEQLTKLIMDIEGTIYYKLDLSHILSQKKTSSSEETEGQNSLLECGTFVDPYNSKEYTKFEKTDFYYIDKRDLDNFLLFIQLKYHNLRSQKTHELFQDFYLYQQFHIFQLHNPNTKLEDGSLHGYTVNSENFDILVPKNTNDWRIKVDEYPGISTTVDRTEIHQNIERSYLELQFQYKTSGGYKTIFCFQVHLPSESAEDPNDSLKVDSENFPYSIAWSGGRDNNPYKTATFFIDLSKLERNLQLSEAFNIYDQERDFYKATLKPIEGKKIELPIWETFERDEAGSVTKVKENGTFTISESTSIYFSKQYIQLYIKSGTELDFKGDLCAYIENPESLTFETKDETNERIVVRKPPLMMCFLENLVGDNSFIILKNEDTPNSINFSLYNPKNKEEKIGDFSIKNFSNCKAYIPEQDYRDFFLHEDSKSLLEKYASIEQGVFSPVQKASNTPVPFEVGGLEGHYNMVANEHIYLLVNLNELRVAGDVYTDAETIIYPSEIPLFQGENGFKPTASDYAILYENKQLFSIYPKKVELVQQNGKHYIKCYLMDRVFEFISEDTKNIGTYKKIKQEESYAVPKDKYEISVWEDYLEGGVFYERKICVIGSSSMTDQCKAINPELTPNINGTTSFTFQMYRTYVDTSTGEQKKNPFCHYLINERKIKLYWDNKNSNSDKWYDFVIKDISESSNSRLNTYTCQDLFITELSKNGYEINFTEEGLNNQGTAQELGQQALEGSGWVLDVANSDHILQTRPDAVYKATFMCDSTKASIIKHIKCTEDENLKPQFKLGQTCYVPFTLSQHFLGQDLTLSETPFQFIYDASGDYDTDPDSRTINSPNSSWYCGGTCTWGKTTEGDYVLYIDNKENQLLKISKETEVSSTYRGNIYVRKQLSLYDTNTERFVKVYKDPKGNMYYGYTDFDFDKDAVVGTIVEGIQTYLQSANWSNVKTFAEGVAKGTITNISDTYTVFGEILNGALAKLFPDFVNLSDSTESDSDTTMTQFEFKLRAAEKEEKNIDAVYQLLDTDLNSILAYDSENPKNVQLTLSYESIVDEQGQPVSEADIKENIALDIVDENGNSLVGGEKTPTTVEAPTTTTQKKSFGKIVWDWITLPITVPFRVGKVFIKITAGAAIKAITGEIKGGTQYKEYVVNVVQTDLIQPTKQQASTTETVTTGSGSGKNPEEEIEKIIENKRIVSSEYSVEQALANKKERYYYYRPGTATVDRYGKVVFKIGDTVSTLLNDLVKLSPSYKEKDKAIHEESVNSYINQANSYFNSITSNKKATTFLTNITKTLGETISNISPGIPLYGFLIPMSTLRKVYSGPVTSDETGVTYVPFEKVRTLTISKSNRYNILQQIAELFQVWCRFSIEHEEDGRIKRDDSNNYIKKVAFKKEVGNKLSYGFTYGTDLNSIERTVSSSNIVTKTIVNSSNNEHSESGVCSITESTENPSLENYIFNFDYYIKQKLLDINEINRDLYSSSGMNYYATMRKLNSQYDRNTNSYIMLSNLDTKVTAKVTVYQEMVKACIKEIADKMLEMGTIAGGFSIAFAGTLAQQGFDTMSLLISSALNVMASAKGDELDKQIEQMAKQMQAESGALVSQLLNNTSNLVAMGTELVKELIPLGMAISSITVKLTNAAAILVTLQAALLAIHALMRTNRARHTTLLTEIKELRIKFYKKYSRFIQEGTWQSDQYLDPTLYYMDALEIANTSAKPSIKYEIAVTRVSDLEDFKFKVFSIGDVTTIQDPEFFGSKFVNGILTPYKEQVVISQANFFLDEPFKDTISVQNYRTQFEDLFHRITASVQTLQQIKGSVAKTSKLVSNSGALKTTVVQQAIQNSDTIVEDSTSNETAQDATGVSSRKVSTSRSKLKMSNGAIIKTDDNGETWEKMMDTDGINPSMVKSGILSLSELTIQNNDAPGFRLDKNGFTAYDWDKENKSLNLLKFVRYNQYGMFGYVGDRAPIIQSLEDAQEETAFSLTWDGLRFNSKDKESDRWIKRAFFGKIPKEANNENESVDEANNESVDEYGIQLLNNEGTPVFEIGNDGNLTIQGHIKVADEKNNIIELLSPKEYDDINYRRTEQKRNFITFTHFHNLESQTEALNSSLSIGELELSSEHEFPIVPVNSSNEEENVTTKICSMDLLTPIKCDIQSPSLKQGIAEGIHLGLLKNEMKFNGDDTEFKPQDTITLINTDAIIFTGQVYYTKQPIILNSTQEATT